MSVLLVMGMGVDYRIFVVDAGVDRESRGATLLGLLLSCLTPVFVNGTLALSSREAIGEMDNTLFIYIAGDNGTSAEGGFVGMYNEMTYFNNVTEKVEDLLPLIDKWGGPETFPHMAAGWAVAFDAPFSWTK